MLLLFQLRVIGGRGVGAVMFVEWCCGEGVKMRGAMDDAARSRLEEHPVHEDWAAQTFRGSAWACDASGGVVV